LCFPFGWYATNHFFIVLNRSSLDSIVDIIKELISLREEIDREHDLLVYHPLHRI
jgi:hypothetical protein